MAGYKQRSRRNTAAGATTAVAVPATAKRINAILCACALALWLAGCKDDRTKKALAEAAQARAEAVKLKAEILRLEGQRSDLIYRVQAAELEKETTKEQFSVLLVEQDDILEESHESQQEIETLKTKLAEQTKRANDLEKQVEQLKAVIREFQAGIEKRTAEQPSAEPNASPLVPGG